MLISDFNYNLPRELIAQKPTFPRDQCRLLVLDRKSGKISHHHFFEIKEFLRAGDVLILNDSKVFKARLFGKIRNYELGVKVEIFLLRPTENNVWEVLGNPGRKLKTGARVWFLRKVWCEVVGQRDGKYLARFNLPNNDLMKWVARYGHVPVPPYIKREPKKFEEYQTVYARYLGSVAAPTAGFHFTKLLLNKLRRKGVEVHCLTLHVGYGTFKPIKTERVEEHQMEPEWVEIPKATAEAINRAKKEGRRVVAVGTTSVRAIEGVYRKLKIKNAKFKNTIQNSKLFSYSSEVNLFIAPGFKFQVIDALITNFHLPRSTLLLLVSAFADRNSIMKAYQEAIKKKYRFYSFGDAMLIV